MFQPSGMNLPGMTSQSTAIQRMNTGDAGKTSKADGAGGMNQCCNSQNDTGNGANTGYSGTGAADQSGSYDADLNDVSTRLAGMMLSLAGAMLMQAGQIFTNGVANPNGSGARDVGDLNGYGTQSGGYGGSGSYGGYSSAVPVEPESPQSRQAQILLANRPGQLSPMRNV